MSWEAKILRLEEGCQTKDATAKKQDVMLVCGEGRPGNVSVKRTMLLENHHLGDTKLKVSREGLSG